MLVSIRQIEKAIAKSSNLTEAATVLGIGHSTLKKYIKQNDIEHKCKRSPRGTRKPKSKAKKGRGGNQYTVAKELGLPKPVVSKETREKISKSLKRMYTATEYWTEERRKIHSDAMQRAVQNNPDSYSKNNVSGRVSIIEYNGAKLKGSWELKTAQWLDSLNIVWENEANPQSYFWKNKWRLYFPDFYLPNYNCYIEVKGYRTERDLCKWNSFSGDLRIIDSKIVNRLSEISLDDLVPWCNWKHDEAYNLERQISG